MMARMWIAMGVKRLQTDSEGYDNDDAQADLNLRWGYVQSCRKYCAESRFLM